MLSSAQIIIEDQNFDGIDLFQTLVVRNKQSGFAFDSRGDLQGVGQTKSIPSANERCRFGQLLVNSNHGKRSESLEREFYFVDETEVFVGERLGENFSDRDGRCDAAQGVIFQAIEHRLKEIGVGSYILDEYR